MTNIPKKLTSNVVFLHDTQFNICKGGVSIQIYSNEDKLFQELFVAWLESMLKAESYAAETLNTKIDFDYGSIMSIDYYGFSDVLVKLVKDLPSLIIKAINTPEKAARIFDIEH
jgi:hypothetical protein